MPGEPDDIDDSLCVSPGNSALQGEIVKLRKENAKLRAIIATKDRALKPFAVWGRHVRPENTKATIECKPEQLLAAKEALDAR